MVSKKKITVGVLFGGKSAEHEVSLQSAKNIIEGIDQKKYDVVLIGIDKNGTWLPAGTSKNLLTNGIDPKLLKLNKQNGSKQSSSLTVLTNHSNNIDVVFPVLHGPCGEDGTVQGFLTLANIPFVGAGVLGSAVGMDKDVMKRLLTEANIPIGKYMVIKKHAPVTYTHIVRKLGSPFFLKPANMGSSVGVSKVATQSEFKKALQEAFMHDKKVIAEKYIKGREIECAVLGNEKPVASVPGEIIVHDSFYSYTTKYIDENGATLAIPAQLSKKQIKQVQKMAIDVFQTLECRGLGRVDFFLQDDGKFLVNEINTMPGFTSMSMYPKLWEASGISYTKLIDTLIRLALEE